MSMIFQSYAIWPNMTVARERRLRARGAQGPARGDPPPAWTRSSTWCSSAHLRDRYPAELSGGQQQRVALARVIVVKPARAAARRAAVQPRREPARGDALRDPPPARRVQDHHGLRHPRPGRGDGDLRPHRRDEPGPRRADRRAASALRAADARASSPGSSAAPISWKATRAAMASTSAASRSPAPLRGRRSHAAGKVMVSLRPQSIHLLRRRPTRADRWRSSRRRIVQRARTSASTGTTRCSPAGSDLSLRVSTRPHEVFEVGAKVWLELDPQQLVADRLKPSVPCPCLKRPRCPGYLKV